MKYTKIKSRSCSDCLVSISCKEDMHNLRMQRSHTQRLRLWWSIQYTIAEEFKRICGKIYIPIHAILNGIRTKCQKTCTDKMPVDKIPRNEKPDKMPENKLV